MMSPAKKKTAKSKPKPVSKPQEILVVSEQPVRITTATVQPGKRTVWTTVQSVGTGLFYAFGILIGLLPILAHIGTAVYCGHGETARCVPVDFPPWVEFAGIVIALIFANAARDVVSKSAKQLFDAAKNLPDLLARRNDSPPAPPGGV
jgi:hypothetical protein